jgi:hypothetical protein
MKKNLLIILIILFYNNNNDCALGCMDNSLHLVSPYDFKKYNYVRCECPCTDVIDSKGTCRRCIHYGRPTRGELNGLQDLCNIFR